MEGNRLRTTYWTQLWSVKHDLATGHSASISRRSGHVLFLGCCFFFYVYVFFCFLLFFFFLFVCFLNVTFSFTQFVSGIVYFTVTSGSSREGAQLTMRGGGFLLYRYFSLVYLVC
jgi:hypothetical protein